MAILTTIKKFMPYVKTTAGYVAYRLSSQAVQMDNGKTLETTVGELNNKLVYKVETGSGNGINGNYTKWSDGTLNGFNIPFVLSSISSISPSHIINFPLVLNPNGIFQSY